MLRSILILISIICAVLITFLWTDAAGSFTPVVLLFLAWDFSPLFLVVLFAIFWNRPPSGSNPNHVAIRAGWLTYCIVSLALTAWLYLDFLYYLKTSDHVSSTSGLAFLAYPIVAVAGGFTGGLTAFLIAFFFHRRTVGTGATRH